MTELAPVFAILEQEIGLDGESVGRRAIELAVARRAAARALDLPSYARALQTKAELDALIDELVVPETWFFRDGAPFQLIARTAAAFVAAPRLRQFRVLSVPCSTGEEPYSVAIALLEAGLEASHFVVDAYDLSPRSIEAARGGTFGKSSFRGTQPWALGNYFDGEPGKQTIKPSVRTAVRFAQHNVLAPGFLADVPRYDVVLCRNLLIYLTTEARTRVVDLIDRALHDDGIVIVGHAEALDRVSPRFRSTGHPGAFAYQREGARPVAPALKPNAKVAPKPVAKLAAKPPAVVTKVAPLIAAAPAESRPEFGDSLAAATGHADRGELAAAASMCERLIATMPPDAAIYTLLGVVLQASANRPAAERAFNQALYVDPSHREALLHLALLLRQRGQDVAADQLVRRAERAALREPK